MASRKGLMVWKANVGKPRLLGRVLRLAFYDFLPCLCWALQDRDDFIFWLAPKQRIFAFLTPWRAVPRRPGGWFISQLSIARNACPLQWSFSLCRYVLDEHLDGYAGWTGANVGAQALERRDASSTVPLFSSWLLNLFSGLSVNVLNPNLAATICWRNGSSASSTNAPIVKGPHTAVVSRPW